MRESRPPGPPTGPPPERDEATEQWIDEGEIRDEASRAVGRAETPEPARARRRPTGTAAGDEADLADVSAELRRADPIRGERLAASLKDAARAFERERYQDARKLLRRLAERAPGVAAVRELYGLTLYRMGSYRLAAKELEAFQTLTQTTEQHPVLADSYRALRRHRRVEELWEELRAASPSGELVAEGRIVMAGSLADRGDVQGAIDLLEQAKGDPKRPKVHHLRLWYALADLYERAGEVPRARQIFERIARHDRDFADVGSRLRALD
jgi:tetratricopeptide (TPR) repeat protein